MLKIAVLIDRDFEDSEYYKPAEAFRQEGFELTHIGLQEGNTVKGKKEGTTVRIDMAAKEARADQFDALLIPGGYSPDNLRAHEEPVRFVKEFMETGKPVFAICHGPQILISARKLEGRTVTGYKSIVEDIRYSGANFIDQEVVVDGNLVTSRTPADLPAFIRESMKKLKSGEAEAEAA